MLPLIKHANDRDWWLCMGLALAGIYGCSPEGLGAHIRSGRAGGWQSFGGRECEKVYMPTDADSGNFFGVRSL
jgi:hypothetical protein